MTRLHLDELFYPFPTPTPSFFSRLTDLSISDPADVPMCIELLRHTPMPHLCLLGVVYWTKYEQDTDSSALTPALSSVAPQLARFVFRPSSKMHSDSLISSPPHYTSLQHLTLPYATEAISALRLIPSRLVSLRFLEFDNDTDGDDVEQMKIVLNSGVACLSQLQKLEVPGDSSDPSAELEVVCEAKGIVIGYRRENEVLGYYADWERWMYW